MINRTHLKELITDSIEAIGLNSESAVNLLMGTAAQESRLGHFLKQLKRGPALGIFQMEPATFDYHVKYLNEKKPELKNKILEFCGVSELKVEYLRFNLAFAACMSRVHYFRIKKKLPQADDLKGLAAYWKKYYNSELGKGTPEEFIRHYKEYVA